MGLGGIVNSCLLGSSRRSRLSSLSLRRTNIVPTRTTPKTTKTPPTTAPAMTAVLSRCSACGEASTLDVDVGVEVGDEREVGAVGEGGA